MCISNRCLLYKLFSLTKTSDCCMYKEIEDIVCRQPINPQPSAIFNIHPVVIGVSGHPENNLLQETNIIA